MGIWDASAAQHSQSLEAWFAHLPGLVVVCPGNPQDNHSLLRAALQSGDPVIYMEHKTLWGQTGPVDVNLKVPLGKAATLRRGEHVTLVSWSRQLLACEAACQSLATQGISVELIDLRTLWPWDRETVLNSCAKTGHLLVVHEAVQAAGFGAEIAATVAEQLGVRVKRLGAPRIPVGYSPGLEAVSRIGPEAIETAVQQLLAQRKSA
jgi:pyruvate dehydrogenase E1 component beta subunit